MRLLSMMHSTYYVAGIPFSSENSLYHFGIKGQRWGIRRYQNPDGSLTSAGKARYGTEENFNNKREYEKTKKEYSRAAKIARLATGFSPIKTAIPVALVSGSYAANKAKKYREARKRYKDSLKRDMGKDLESEELKKSAIKAAAVVGSVMAIYGTKKIIDVVNQGNADYLNAIKDNVELTIAAIGDKKVDASFFEKARNAYKYHKNKDIYTRRYLV